MTDAQHDVPSSVMARAFGAEAARYDQARPSYPAAAVARVLGALAPAEHDRLRPGSSISAPGPAS